MNVKYCSIVKNAINQPYFLLHVVYEREIEVFRLKHTQSNVSDAANEATHQLESLNQNALKPGLIISYRLQVYFKPHIFPVSGWPVFQ